MDLSLALLKNTTTTKTAEELLSALSDIPQTLSHFPKLKPLTELAENRYQWDLETIGAAGVEHDVSFATDFVFEPEKGQITFTPVPGVGNAQISGYFKVADNGNGSDLTLDIEGTLKDIKVPMLLRAPAKPFIKGIFESLVDKFVERVHQRYA